jgi:sarcosine oxidase subunit gamma
MPNFQPYLQSPLVNFNLPAETVAADNSQLARANELALLGYIVIRGELNDPAIAAAIKSASGVAVPTSGQFTSGEGGVLIWQSPDEALLVTKRSYVSKLLKAFDEAFNGLFAQAVDNSGGLTTVYLSGVEHVTVLRHMGVYYFESIASGQAVSTVLGKAGAIIARVDGEGVFMVWRRSFADYLWLLLRKVGIPYRFAVAKLPESSSSPFLRLVDKAAQSPSKAKVAA